MQEHAKKKNLRLKKMPWRDNGPCSKVCRKKYVLLQYASDCNRQTCIYIHVNIYIYVYIYTYCIHIHRGASMQAMASDGNISPATINGTSCLIQTNETMYASKRQDVVPLNASRKKTCGDVKMTPGILQCSLLWGHNPQLKIWPHTMIYAVQRHAIQRHAVQRHAMHCHTMCCHALCCHHAMYGRLTTFLRHDATGHGDRPVIKTESVQCCTIMS